MGHQDLKNLIQCLIIALVAYLYGHSLARQIPRQLYYH
jgi:hypothetical protein